MVGPEEAQNAVFAASRGFQIRYQVIGDGPVLVLLHGHPMWGERWADRGYVAVLERQYRLIVPDLFGHGGSDKSDQPADHGIGNYAADVVAVLDAEGVSQAHVWGYSMGAMVAERIAVTAPERVRALILGGFPPGLDLRQRGGDAPAPPPSSWEEALAEYPPRIAEMFQAHNDLSSIQACRAAIFSSATTLDELRAAPHPTLAYIGADDPRIGQAQKQCAALPCPLEIVPGGHIEAFVLAENVLPAALGHLESCG